ncbi:MAG: InlB B-repeat-containing protein [Treponema sp.]|nr:InlB B-repeat-containing protein [Treponema sp.]
MTRKSVFFIIATALCMTSMLSSCSISGADQTGSVAFQIDGSAIKEKINGVRSAGDETFFMDVSILGDYKAVRTVLLEDRTSVCFDSIPVGVKIHAFAKVYKKDSSNVNSLNHVLYAGESNEIVIKEGENELSLTLKTARTVTFDTNEGSSVDPQIIIDGKTAVKPKAPTKDGFIFDGWYEDAELETEFNFSTPVSSDITLFAKWHSSTPEFKGTGYTVLTPEAGQTVVQFGDWPQTIKAASVTVDETKSAVIGANTYYYGSDGAWYAKCAENAYEPGYKYSDETDVNTSSANSTRYFKVEPIKWRVLTDNYSGKKLLLAANVLMPHRFDSENNNYKDSDIREWLNGEFLNAAFTSDAVQRIAVTNVNNSLESTGDSANSHICANTNDMIFLLSRNEAGTYFSTNDSRIINVTDYSKARGVQVGESGTSATWWLRSPYDGGYGDRSAKVVGSDGVISTEVEDVSYDEARTVTNIYHGVVPALCISN